MQKTCLDVFGAQLQQGLVQGGGVRAVQMGQCLLECLGAYCPAATAAAALTAALRAAHLLLHHLWNHSTSI